MKNLAKIDKFYFILVIVLVFLSAVFAYAFRGIFTAFVTSYEINPPLQQNNKIDLINLNRAKELLFDVQAPDFVDARQPEIQPPLSTPTPIPTTTPVQMTNPDLDAVE